MADVLETTPSALITLREANALAPYFSPEASSFPDDAREPATGGLAWWVSDRESYVSFTYNTNAVPPDLVPKTVRDLLHPGLKGKLAIPGSDTGVRFVGNLLTHQGEEFAQQFARQEVAVQMISGGAMAELVGNGEVPATPSVAHANALQVQAKGAPIRWVPLEPVTVNRGSVAISAHAPHPHAAVLFADFLLGPEGQALLEQHEYGSPATNPGFQLWDPERGLTAAEYDQRFRQWEQFMRTQVMRR